MVCYHSILHRSYNLSPAASNFVDRKLPVESEIRNKKDKWFSTRSYL